MLFFTKKCIFSQAVLERKVAAFNPPRTLYSWIKGRNKEALDWTGEGKGMGKKGKEKKGENVQWRRQTIKAGSAFKGQLYL